MTSILVVEDNLDLAANILDYMESCGHEADAAADGREALRLTGRHRYDAIVLDLALPGVDGLTVCRRLREAGDGTPVIMLTARGELEEKLAGIEHGADDYLVKPVALAELEARVRAQVRRARGEFTRTRLRVGELELDERTHEVVRAGRPVNLARADFLLLRRLMRDAPDVVTRGVLEEAVWGDEPPATDTLRAHIHRLRRAIDHPFTHPMLRTVHGVGYRLVAPDDAPA
ncbi:response regulator transcription factor [Arhodomonas aquaeolei]|uniref:response regulator transcription factor n=1 Tax=Arhodomonas aquaeolei TaxID=2369 RepID=UPI0021693B59|nr:response regulator transcription factor [Arhodomonas aquaeolei]MCS4502768.1 response regulator transcription factor [Arhodomonas aquaeolei]